MATFVPTSLVPAARDEARLVVLQRGLTEAERAFSDEAPVIGLGAAFTKWGSATAVNMAGPLGQPFFSIWHRASPTAPWHYIAG